MDNTVAIVLGGGRGTRLLPLTGYRSKPAVPLAGKYRLIDIPLSNCINSGINRIYVLTQFLSVSLHQHIRGTYNFDNFSGGFVEILAAQQTMVAGTDWYQGTADAVRKNLRYFSQPGIEHVLILSGDQLYRMDFEAMLAEHIDTNADVTIAGKPVQRSEASGLGIMRVDESGRVIGFLEKPQTEEELQHVRMDPAWIEARGIESAGRDCLASMGIYLFRRDVLMEVLNKTDYQDFGKEVFPASIRSRHVQLHLFDGYWEDIGTIRSFYDSNLALANANPPFHLASEDRPIYSRPRYLPPTRIDEATIRHSLIADGCQIDSGAVIENSVIGLRTHIGAGVVVRDSIIMGCDDYESPALHEQACKAGIPPRGIGEGSVVEGAIIDKNCRIGPRSRICCPENIKDGEYGCGCVVQDGIIIVPKDSILPQGWSIR